MNMNTNVETTGLKCHHKTDKLCEIVLHKVAWNRHVAKYSERDSSRMGMVKDQR